MSRTEFEKRFRARFADPAFAAKQAEIGELMEVAWDGYHEADEKFATPHAR
jgi:hypothetical protein